MMRGMVPAPCETTVDVSIYYHTHGMLIYISKGMGLRNESRCMVGLPSPQP